MNYLVCGLGNIGPEYELTRHNIGFLTLDRLAEARQLRFETRRYAAFAEMKWKGKKISLIKPHTFMNLSGKAVAFWMQALKVPKTHTLIIVDDLALPFGHLRLRPSGSAAGHNGLKNIELTLNTQDYPRLRLGIGNNFPRGGQVDYVLSNFTQEEFAELPLLMDKAIETIQSFCAVGIERTMNTFNNG
ncbi:MAG: aminoacyl-tRNA hydrolase [Candidatus Nephrothrix sp. EaCA]|nr:MAG: aminoacyl-tRNA hydrolase [Candidatus Nephrothrix sp. EaCA]